MKLLWFVCVVMCCNVCAVCVCVCVVRCEVCVVVCVVCVCVCVHTYIHVGAIPETACFSGRDGFLDEHQRVHDTRVDNAQ